MAQRYFAVVTPGLEDALVQELRAFRAKKLEVQTGGVEFQATRRGLYQILQGAAVPNGLLLRLDDFRAKGPIELYNKTRRFAWERLVSPEHAVRVDATSRRSRLSGTGQIEDTIRSAIRDHFTLDLKASPPSFEPDSDALRVVARLEADRCQLNLDAAQRPLYIRGWRKKTGAAPLRETTAAALLRVAGWAPGVALVDAACGSGTFCIEAAVMAQNASPRRDFPYAVARWSNYDADLFAQTAPEPTADAAAGLLFGFDVDADVLSTARANATRAGVDALVSFAQRDVSDLTPPADTPAGVVVCNPPYGSRLPRKKGSGSVESVLLDRFASEFPAGWRLGLLTPRDFSPSHPDLDAAPALAFRNGGKPVSFHVFTHRGMEPDPTEDKLTGTSSGS
jgi:23S rRNA G2445 N2-methylase RlmL